MKIYQTIEFVKRLLGGVPALGLFNVVFKRLQFTSEQSRTEYLGNFGVKENCLMDNIKLKYR